MWLNLSLGYKSSRVVICFINLFMQKNPSIRLGSLEASLDGISSLIYRQGLIQAVFDIGIPILGTLIWVCPNLILSKTETTIKHNSSFFYQIGSVI